MSRTYGREAPLLTNRRGGAGPTSQHGLLRMILMHTIPPVRMSKHWTARLKTPEPRYSTMRYRPAMTVPTSMGKLTVSSSPFRFGSKTTFGVRVRVRAGVRVSGQGQWSGSGWFGCGSKTTFRLKWCSERSTSSSSSESSCSPCSRAGSGGLRDGVEPTAALGLWWLQ